MSEHHSTRPLTQANFESVIDENQIVLIDFWAEWCAPCKQFAKVYEKVASQFKEVIFAQVNIEEQAELAEMFQIRSIPHLVVFKEGIVIYSEAGSMPESTLKELVQQAIDVDVSDIKEQLNKEE
ncbi:thioredoxin [Legionella yabuuchiae]|uniref:thioredoxin n=1 Tax=Legionella yabuuchiae TaxID=376727 RepID=UPI001054D17A|nr:thioredoxin [Legionella yabuuchiae]